MTRVAGGDRSQLCRWVAPTLQSEPQGGLTRLRLGARKASGPLCPPARPLSSQTAPQSPCPPTSAKLFPGSGSHPSLSARVLVSLGGPGGRGGGPWVPEASSGSTPPRCLGNPTPKAGDLQKPGLGAQPALPSWARPGFSPAHHSSGVLSPHPSSYGIRNCSRLGSGGLPTLRGTALPMALCSGLGHTCSTPRSPAGPLGKSGPGNASLKELAGWGRFSGTRGGPGPGAAPGRDLLTVGSGESC